MPIQKASLAISMGSFEISVRGTGSMTIKQLMEDPKCWVTDRKENVVNLQLVFEHDCNSKVIYSLNVYCMNHIEFCIASVPGLPQYA